MAQARWHGDDVIARYRAAGDAGLEAAAAHLLEQSQRIVPYEKGELSRSGASGLGPVAEQHLELRELVLDVERAEEFVELVEGLNSEVAEIAGADWTVEVKQQWTLAYTAIAGMMQAGAIARAA